MNEGQELLQREGSREPRHAGTPSATGRPAPQPDARQIVPGLRTAHAKLRLWEEGILFGAVITVVLAAYVIWAVIMLSGGVSLEVKQLATALITLLSAGLFRLLRRKLENSL